MLGRGASTYGAVGESTLGWDTRAAGDGRDQEPGGRTVRLPTGGGARPSRLSILPASERSAGALDDPDDDDLATPNMVDRSGERRVEWGHQGRRRELGRPLVITGTGRDLDSLVSPGGIEPGREQRA